MRESKQIARRILVLQAVVAASHNVERQMLRDWLVRENLVTELTQRENEFLSDEPSSDSEVSYMTWMCEAQYLLMWAAGFIGVPESPNKKCNTREIHRYIPALSDSIDSFVSQATVQPIELLEELEAEIYDIHVDLNAAARAGRKAPNGYDKGVVFFRHYALLWLTDDEDWASVSVDT